MSNTLAPLAHPQWRTRTPGRTRSTAGLLRRPGPLVAVLAGHAVLVGLLLALTAHRDPSPPEPRPVQVLLLHAPTARVVAPTSAWPVPLLSPVTPPLLPVPRIPPPPIQPPAAAPAPSASPSPSVPAPTTDPMPTPLTPAPATAAAPAQPASAPAPQSAPAPLRPPPPNDGLPQIPPSALRYRVPPQPVYPRASRRLRESGQVLVRLHIDAEGRPEHVRVERTSGFERLDQSAVAAVRAARFHPYSENGQHRAGWAVIPLVFDLEGP